VFDCYLSDQARNGREVLSALHAFKIVRDRSSDVPGRAIISSPSRLYSSSTHGCVTARNFRPVDHVAERGDVLRPSVLILQIVRMLPDIQPWIGWWPGINPAIDGLS
jgi:hypothetical protein